jgi:hypothetical protein
MTKQRKHYAPKEKVAILSWNLLDKESISGRLYHSQLGLIVRRDRSNWPVNRPDR